MVLDHHQVSAPRAGGGGAGQSAIGRRLSANFVPPAWPSSSFTPCSSGCATWACPEADAVDLRAQLDLVALGTIADLVPLTGENRILVSAGLERLNATHAPGPGRAESGRRQRRPSSGSYEVAFQLAPAPQRRRPPGGRPGRLRLLLTSDATEARAARPSRWTKATAAGRKSSARSATKSPPCSGRASTPEKDFVIVEGRAEWHIGVVGIVASRVLQEFYRPTIIFGGDGACWRGSGRSIEGFDLAAALLRLRRFALAPRRPRHGGGD